MKQSIFTITKNAPVTSNVYSMELKGDTDGIKCGQFVNIKIEGLYLRRPISVCDLEGDVLTLIYKVVGKGTEIMSKMEAGVQLDLLTGLGNGYDTSLSGDKPLLLGGGVGVPPLYLLCRKLIGEGKQPTVILGFNTKDEVFYENEFAALSARVIVATADGSHGVKGFVTTALEHMDYTCYGRR